MAATRLIFLLLLALAGCGQMDAPATQGWCEIGKPYQVNQPGTIVVHTPVVKEGFEVLAILQRLAAQLKAPPMPIHYGQLINDEVDAGTVDKYTGPGFTLIYFPVQASMPQTLPWVDRQGICRGNAPVVVSEDVRGFAYVKMKHWGYVQIPTSLVHDDALYAQPWHLKVLHTPLLTAGPFRGVHGVVGSYPGAVSRALAAGHGTYFLFIAAPNQPPEWQ